MKVVTKICEMYRKLLSHIYTNRVKKILKKPRHLFFFFPTWYFGGADRVHLDILKVFKNEDSICFLNHSANNLEAKKEFEGVTTLIFIEKLKLRSYMLRKIASAINQQKEPIVFGCAVSFFYDLIPLLASHVKIIDLTHCFGKGGEMELRSLPNVERLDKRVVLGEKTKLNFQKLYELFFVPETCLERFCIIPNQITTPVHTPSKNYTSDTLKVLLVCRNSPEKRPDLFLKIAESCYEKHLPFEFSMIGAFEKHRGNVIPNVEIIGEIYNRDELNRYYIDAHLLLVTSLNEGFPMVMLEGMSNGVVPIATAVGEIPEHIAPIKKNGFLVAYEDDADIVAHFVDQLTYLSNNRDVIEEYSRNVYEYVKGEFSPEHFSEAYRSLFFDS